MPRYCCVPNCTSNRPGKEYVSSFRFPKDPEYKALWKRKIPRDFDVKPDSTVCAKHFSEEDIIKIDSIKMKDGSILQSPRTIPKLADNAVPSIFPGCPAYLTENKTTRTATVEREAKMKRLDDQLLNDWMEQDKISNINILKEELHAKLKTFLEENDTLIHKCEKCVTFVFFSCDSSHVNKSLKISDDLCMSFCVEKKTYETGRFEKIFKVTNKLKCWSELEHILGICKGQNLSGLTLKNPQEQATKMQVFMLSSIFSKTKEIIALVPVTNINAEDLYDLVLKCLKMLYEIGFNVLTIISDNNRINRNMFVKLCGGAEMKISIPNPFNDSQKIFLMFDTVHILKSIRNNWVNQKDELKCFTYKNLNTSITNSASFTVLDCLYKSERNSIIKLAPKLTVKALNPSSLEKQNVKLALKIFDRSNIAPLKLFIPNDKNITHKLCLNTSFFIEQIVCWWEIMNIKTPDKGKRLRLEFSDPFRSADDKRFAFLNSFVKWLKDWESKKQKPKQGGLSRETFFSLIHTTECMSEIIKYLLTFSPYVLCGKFQTDNLEARFGQYRQMSGSNYYISVEQILEAEKKLRIKSLLHLKSKMYGTFSLQNLITSHSCNEESSDVQLSEMLSSVLDDSLDFDVLSKNDLKVLTYISGYCAFKLKISCIECLNIFLTEKTMDLDLSSDKSFEYLNILDRGGLKIPSKFTLMVVSTCYLIFLRLISSELENEFLSSCNQANILKCLTLSYLESVEDFDKTNCSKCNCPKILVTVKIIKTMCNICLNNYAKKKNEVEKQKKDGRKIKKLKSDAKT